MHDACEVWLAWCEDSLSNWREGNLVRIAQDKNGEGKKQHAMRGWCKPHAFLFSCCLATIRHISALHMGVRSVWPCLQSFGACLVLGYSLTRVVEDLFRHSSSLTCITHFCQPQYLFIQVRNVKIGGKIKPDLPMASAKLLSTEIGKNSM